MQVSSDENVEDVVLVRKVPAGTGMYMHIHETCLWGLNARIDTEHERV
jgi:hypothetical protein